MAEMKSASDLLKSSLTDRIQYVVEHAASRLAPDVGRQLLTLIEPSSLATMAAVLTVWTGSQFCGFGEIADTGLLIGGWVLFGDAVWQAAKLLFQCAMLTVRPSNLADLDKAGEDLAEVVAILGVQGTFAILLRKPGNAFKNQFFATAKNPNPAPWKSFQDLPTTTRWGYKPTTRVTFNLGEGEGRTNKLGDILISLHGTENDRRLPLAHEEVHRFLRPKLNLLRRLRMFTVIQGYNRSYFLRYLEEAFAQTFAELKVNGFTAVNFVRGIKFPLGDFRTNDDYKVTIGDISGEARQIFLGPIIVGGMTYQVWISHHNSVERSK